MKVPAGCRLAARPRLRIDGAEWSLAGQAGRRPARGRQT